MVAALVLNGAALLIADLPLSAIVVCIGSLVAALVLNGAALLIADLPFLIGWLV